MTRYVASHLPGTIAKQQSSALRLPEILTSFLGRWATTETLAMASTAAPSTAVVATQDQPQHSRITRTKDTLKYLYDPKIAPQPSHLRTRTFLRSLRYFTIFLFWRLVRYAKYAAMGAIVAAVSGTAIASVASGAAFVIAPTGILGGAGMGLLWAVARFGWRRARARVGRKGGKEGSGDPRADERADAEGVEERHVRPPPRVEPW